MFRHKVTIDLATENRYNKSIQAGGLPMNENFTVRKASENDISLIENLIKGLAAYEKRPQDMTAAQEDLRYLLFEKNIATVLIAELNGEPVGYAIYYPVFASFAAKAGVHLEDLFLMPEKRRSGLGTRFFAEAAEFIKQDGFSYIEWSCLDWNEPAINFYNKIGAEEEHGRRYFSYSL
jgi:GNAT superfamily N-acetyltransferase